MNDLRRAWPLRSWLVLGALNGISVAVAGLYGVNALLDPGGRAGITGPVTGDLVIYASLYGIRSTLLAIAILVLLFTDRRRGGDRLRPMLFLAGAIQAADTALLLAASGDVAMAVGPAVAAVTHLLSAALLGRRRAIRSASNAPVSA